MTVKHLATGLAALGGAFIIYIGLSYLLAPQTAAAGFGVPTWPRRDGTAFLAVKGVRDIATGLVLFALLLSGHRRALGWAMLATAFVPAGDMVIVLSNNGSPGTAYGIHGLTAVAVAVTAGLLLRERRLPATTPRSGETASRAGVGAGPSYPR
ncbi:MULTISPECIES: DUF4267 domain-containing protein [unclassified Streptomyces]|uniref:DUF4267 domain-containing protein n=1 Tax=unclassified Streptomyces TaxID=2593676 RepID=UPI002DDAE0A4|nr:DUF4267 domain-containing protein [Streptomyces sp. NBC_01750]WSB04776.1 DUF4267 domain-containing protein [Streptomyces sp. NBC_01794]WSD30945.1 DUF4267 domain-containing protein [Streptomyces sp. NBC_01750]